MRNRIIVVWMAIASTLFALLLALSVLVRFNPNPQSLPLHSLPYDLLFVLGLRYALLAALAYLLLATIVSFLATLNRFAGVRSFAHALTPHALTRLVQFSVALTLTTSAFPFPAAQATTTPPPTLVHLGPLPKSSEPSSTVPPPHATTPTTTPTTVPPSPSRARLPLSDPSVSWHTVQRGESFWSIAETHYGTTINPSDREVTAYWERLIDANRHELRDPNNPDLIFPGQVFRLPPHL